MTTDSPGYYSILTAAVRYDKDLSDFAKILYSDITALCNKRGYCTASNDYFETVFSKSRRTIISTIAALTDAGYITVEVIRDEQNAVVERRIWVDANAAKNDAEQGQGCAENCTTPGAENCTTPGAENCTYNNTSIYNINPHTPTGGGAADKQTDGFDAFWAAYPKRVAKKPARRAWDKLHANGELLTKILAALEWQKRTEAWQRDGGRYVPNAATWLNAQRWEDERQPVSEPPKRRKEETEVW